MAGFMVISAKGQTTLCLFVSGFFIWPINSGQICEGQVPYMRRFDLIIIWSIRRDMRLTQSLKHKDRATRSLNSPQSNMGPSKKGNPCEKHPYSERGESTALDPARSWWFGFAFEPLVFVEIGKPAQKHHQATDSAPNQERS